MNMHKAMYERVYGRPYEIDERDRELTVARAEARNKLQGPLVGDYVITPKGYLRFTYDWGAEIQTTVRPGYDASFYIDKSGYMSFSGSLDPSVQKDRLELTDEIKDGSCWFFSHDYTEAHNGVHVTVPCKVYRLKANQ